MNKMKNGSMLILKSPYILILKAGNEAILLHVVTSALWKKILMVFYYKFSSDQHGSVSTSHNILT